MATIERSSLELVLRRDRRLVLAGLIGIAALAWLYLIDMARGMGDVPMAMGAAMATMQPAPWSALDFALMFAMWAIMMVGMMVPSAAPTILLYATVARKSRNQGRPIASAYVFAGGYIVAWTAFSLIATVLQWALDQTMLLSPMMVSTSAWLGAGLFLAAGIYQLTPLKHACLHHCRSPLHFLTQRWRRGTGGAFVMGLEHGGYCVGCCWFLMVLLFAGGVMNLLWVAAIAIFVLLEKVAPFGVWIARLSGVAMLGAAGALLWAA